MQLLREKQVARKHTDDHVPPVVTTHVWEPDDSRNVSSVGQSANSDSASFRRKRPQLSLKLGIGAAAAGGAVRTGFVTDHVLVCARTCRLRFVWCLKSGATSAYG